LPARPFSRNPASGRRTMRVRRSIAYPFRSV
jgi:hypothetical protein